MTMALLPSRSVDAATAYFDHNFKGSLPSEDTRFVYTQISGDVEDSFLGSFVSFIASVGISNFVSSSHYDYFVASLRMININFSSACIPVYAGGTFSRSVDSSQDTLNLYFIVYFPYSARGSSFYAHYTMEPILSTAVDSLSFNASPVSFPAKSSIMATFPDLSDFNLSGSLAQVEKNTGTSANILSTTPPVSGELSSKNNEFSSAMDEYDSTTDTTKQYGAIKDSGLLDFDVGTTFTQMASTITFFSSMVSGMLSSFGDFNIPLTLFLTLVLVSAILSIGSHVTSDSYTGTRNKKDRGG